MNYSEASLPETNAKPVRGRRFAAPHWLAAGLLGLLAVFTSMPGSQAAEAYRPTDPAEILLTLPASYRSLIAINGGEEQLYKPGNASLNLKPENLLKTAENLARLGQFHNEPRFMSRAETLMEKLQKTAADSSAPDFLHYKKITESSRSLVLQASLLQHVHKFTSALILLDEVLTNHPDHIQARLMRAQILLAMANYQAARADCYKMALTADPVLAVLCINQVDGLTRPEANSDPLQYLLTTNLNPEIQQELHLSIALTAERRLDNDSADLHFQQALLIDADRHFARLKYADFLLRQQRVDDALALLEDNHRGKTDLLVSLALAFAHTDKKRLTPKEQASKEAVLRSLQQIFNTMPPEERARNKDYARYLLALQNDPGTALAVATANWQQQKEPADALLLLTAALQTGKASAARPVADWFHNNHIVDQRIARLLDKLEEKQ